MQNCKKKPISNQGEKKSPAVVKKVYTAPQIEVSTVELEDGIAAGSALARPGFPDGSGIQKEWLDADDEVVHGQNGGDKVIW